MTLHVPRVLFSLDPLMAEAKRRARRRRVILVLALAAGAVAAVTFTLPLGGGAGGASSPKSTVQPRQTPPPHRVSSIQVIHEGPLSSVNMMVNDLWHGRVGRHWVLVYAGMWNTETTKVKGKYEPALMLFTKSMKRIGVYPARGSETSVKVTAANGNTLTLVGVGPGSRGQTFRFNVATHTYIR